MTKYAFLLAVAITCAPAAHANPDLDYYANSTAYQARSGEYRPEPPYWGTPLPDRGVRTPEGAAQLLRTACVGATEATARTRATEERAMNRCSSLKRWFGNAYTLFLTRHGDMSARWNTVAADGAS